MRTIPPTVALLLGGVIAVLAQTALAQTSPAQTSPAQTSPTPDAASPAPASPAASPPTSPPSSSAPPPVAQTAPASAPAPTSAQPTPPAPGQPATMSDNLRPTFVAQAPEDMVASKMIGTSVVNRANDTIGQIADFVIAPGGGIKSWVIGVGGVLGIGAKYVAVDPSALKLERVDGKDLRATIDTTQDQLRAAPEYIYLGKAKPN